MAEAAIHLTQNVLPMVPYRQFVVSFPISLRYWLHTNRRFAAEVFGIVTTEIHRYYLSKAHAAGITDATLGSIAFTQRWGSALNLNHHLHLICIDGVYTRYGGVAHFRNLDEVTDDEVASLIESIATRVRGQLTRVSVWLLHRRPSDQYSFEREHDHWAAVRAPALMSRWK